MTDSGRDIAIGYLPQNSNWCDPAIDASCGPLPGKWSDLKIRQSSGSLGLMAVTDAATAARFQISTANLCDSNGAHCVGANALSLDKAASEFTTTGSHGLFQANPAADYAGGAYPLTIPVYAAIAPSMDLADRLSYASALQYVVTAGQKPGFAVGDLPPGYAPLTANLRALATKELTALRSPKTAPKPKPSTTPSTSGSGGTPTGSTPTGPTSVSTPGTTHPSKGGTQTTAAPLMQHVAADTHTWAWYTIPIGLAVSLLAGLAGPLLRFGFGVRLR
jgi:hypothetical protein